jgi:transaldolase / glucose-6-phosphate isomerase
MQPNAVLETAKVTNPIRDLQRQGQSVWLDHIQRNLIISGGLQQLIEEDGVTGITSNPSIFEKAITGGTEYADLLNSTEWSRNLDVKTRYEALAIRDIQDAADLLRPVYENTVRRDGYVSLEVSPYLARDTQGTIQEARALWKSVGRENLMIKVPGTAEGIPAFQHLIADGINVNVTLLFSRKVYQQVAEAYINGLEQFVSRGGDVSKMASVASFFISRIDTAIDSIIASRLKGVKDRVKQEQLKSLLGKVAIANGKLTYQHYLRFFGSARWKTLAAKGAQTQRLLWASTSTKNPNYRDVLYIEELIGRDTVNTVPPVTLDAFRDHGRVRPSLIEDLDSAEAAMQSLAAVGISIDEVTSKLTEDGVRLFVEAFVKLLEAVQKNTAGRESMQN